MLINQQARRQTPPDTLIRLALPPYGHNGRIKESVLLAECKQCARMSVVQTVYVESGQHRLNVNQNFKFCFPPFTGFRILSAHSPSPICLTRDSGTSHSEMFATASVNASCKHARHAIPGILPKPRPTHRSN